MEKQEREEPVFYVMCPEHGKQEAIPGTVRDWGDEAVQLTGQKMVTGNCPKCHSTITIISNPTS